MHAVVRADPERGLHPGVIFTLKNRHPDVGQRAGAAGAEPALAHGKGHHHLLHPFYMVYVGEDGAVLVDHSRVKHLLDLVRLAARGQGEPDAAACAAFNRRTDDGRQMEACSTLLDHAIASIIDVKADGDLDSLFTGTQTTALRDRVQVKRTQAGAGSFCLALPFTLYPSVLDVYSIRYPRAHVSVCHPRGGSVPGAECREGHPAGAYRPVDSLGDFSGCEYRRGVRRPKPARLYFEAFDFGEGGARVALLVAFVGQHRVGGFKAG